MKSVFRYVIGFEGPVTVRLTAPPLAVANAYSAGGGLEFWAETYPDRTPVDTTFQVFGTGHSIPDDAIYIGTAPRTSMGLVFHLYQLMV